MNQNSLFQEKNITYRVLNDIYLNNIFHSPTHIKIVGYKKVMNDEKTEPW
jgi:hypothetical protein